MSQNSINSGKPPQHLDYSLVGEESSRAIERGLAEANWYQRPVPRATLRLDVPPRGIAFYRLHLTPIRP